MQYDEIVKLDSFQRLRRQRKNFMRLAAVVLFILLGGNMFLMSVGHEIGSIQPFSFSSITVIVLYSLFVVIGGCALALCYAFWANRVLDKSIAEVRTDIGGGDNV